MLSYNFYTFDGNDDYTPDPKVPAGAEFGRALFVGANYEEPPGGTSNVVNLTYSHEDVLGSGLSAQLYYRSSELTSSFADLRGGTPIIVGGFPIFLSTIPTGAPVGSLTLGWPEVWQNSQLDTEFGGRLQIDTPLGEYQFALGGRLLSK